jgi:hypothetical protein
LAGLLATANPVSALADCGATVVASAETVGVGAVSTTAGPRVGASRAAVGLIATGMIGVEVPGLKKRPGAELLTLVSVVLGSAGGLAFAGSARSAKLFVEGERGIGVGVGAGAGAEDAAEETFAVGLLAGARLIGAGLLGPKMSDVELPTLAFVELESAVGLAFVGSARSAKLSVKGPCGIGVGIGAGAGGGAEDAGEEMFAVGLLAGARLIGAGLPGPKMSDVELPTLASVELGSAGGFAFAGSVRSEMLLPASGDCGVGVGAGVGVSASDGAGAEDGCAEMFTVGLLGEARLMGVELPGPKMSDVELLTFVSVELGSAAGFGFACSVRSTRSMLLRKVCGVGVGVVEVGCDKMFKAELGRRTAPGLLADGALGMSKESLDTDDGFVSVKGVGGVSAGVADAGETVSGKTENCVGALKGRPVKLGNDSAASDAACPMAGRSSGESWPASSGTTDFAGWSAADLSGRMARFTFKFGVRRAANRLVVDIGLVGDAVR